MLNNLNPATLNPSNLRIGMPVGRRGREPDLSSVGGRIAYARAAKGLTMDQLAGKVGVSKSAISQWERGGIETMKAHHLLKLAKVLEVSPTWLWEWKDEKGEPVPMGRESHLDPDQAALLDTFKLLEPKFRDALIGDANKYLKFSAEQQPSRANPYPKAVKPKK
jgi:transcriptional regulator with XRE-family HTH domain